MIDRGQEVGQDLKDAGLMGHSLGLLHRSVELKQRAVTIGFQSVDFVLLAVHLLALSF